jgi:hypothetical protein
MRCAPARTPRYIRSISSAIVNNPISGFAGIFGKIYLSRYFVKIGKMLRTVQAETRDKKRRPGFSDRLQSRFVSRFADQQQFPDQQICADAWLAAAAGQ